MAPLTIHGNTLDLSSAPDGTFPPDASNSNWILLVCERFPTVKEKQSLQALRVELVQRINDNTFLCRYRASDLRRLEQLDFVEQAVVYHTHFVIHEKLKREDLTDDAREELGVQNHPDHGPICPVIVSMHDGTTPQEVDDVQQHIKTLFPDGQTHWASPYSVCMTIPLGNLDEVASLDQVRVIRPAKAKLAYQVSKACDILKVPGNPHPVFTLGLPPTQNPRPPMAKGEWIAIVDSGFDQGTNSKHPAFFDDKPKNKRKIRVALDTVSGGTLYDEDGHGTHVAGCAVGDYMTTSKAIAAANPGEAYFVSPAPDAYLLSIGDKDSSTDKLFPWHDVTTKRATYEKTSYLPMIRSSSLGDILEQHKPIGSYDEASEVRDQAAIDKGLTIVLCAGNSGNLRMKLPSGLVPWSSIGGHCWSKNSLTVGATYSSRKLLRQTSTVGVDSWMYTVQGEAPLGESCIDGYNAAKKQDVIPAASDRDGGLLKENFVAAFSSKGPSYCGPGQTVEGYLKPDIVAPGLGILSARQRGKKLKNDPNDCWNRSWDPNTTFKNGTSMATPLVAGCLARIREAVRGIEGVATNPCSTLLRAILINGTDSLAGKGFYSVVMPAPIAPATEPPEEGPNPYLLPGRLGPPPDVVQGYGQVNLTNSLLHMDDAARQNGKAWYITNQTLAENEEWPASGAPSKKVKRQNQPIPPSSSSASSSSSAVTNSQQGIIHAPNGSTIYATLCWIDEVGPAMQSRLYLSLEAAGHPDKTAELIHHLTCSDASGNTVDASPDYRITDASKLDLNLARLGTVQKVIWSNIPADLDVQVRVRCGNVVKISHSVPFSVCWRIE